MTLGEVESIAVQWAAEEGWNPGLNDAPCFYAADPEGFFIGLLGGEPISCISAVVYGQEFAFVGFYIVRPGFRGMGYGLKMVEAALAHVGNRNIGLDGVVEQQENYRKAGGKFAYNNIRYEGAAMPAPGKFPELVPLPEVSFDDLVQYDARFFPVPRPQFLRRWVAQPGSIALAAVQHGKIAGFSLVRKCREGYKFGPLFADTRDLAEKLFLASCNFAGPGAKVYLDTPEVNPAAVALAESHGMHKVFETARMYTKSPPEIDLSRVFGVTSFELG